jgi:hypothetical protein
MESSGLAGAVASVASMLFGAILRLAGWLNGLAALMLTGVSLLGTDIELTPALVTFLAGLLSCGLGGVFAYWGDMKVLYQLFLGPARRGHWLLMLLAALASLASLAAFAVGCLMIIDNTQHDPNLSVVHVAEPTVHHSD